MSGRAETEMQIKIMTHGEAFCPSTMTKEILSKNKKRMMVTEMQKGPTEENEIKEGQEKVEEELDNEKKESTFSSPWKFCRNLLKEERGQMDENKIKEGQEVEQEEQGNKRVMYRRRPYFRSVVFTPWTHGEAFCPSTMEIPFANRKLLREEITNNERNEMEEGQMEENEIKEGHDNVEEEQDNKTKETPFGNRKLLLRKITNDERNEMEEGQMEEIEIKEWHVDVEEEQDNEKAISPVLSASLREHLLRMRTKRLAEAIRKAWKRLVAELALSLQKVRSDVIDIGQMEKFKKKKRQKEKEVRSRLFYNIKRTYRNVWRPSYCSEGLISDRLNQFREKRKIIESLFRGGQSRRKLFFRKGRNKREQWESEKERKYLGIWEGRNAITQHAAPQQSGKLIDIIQNQGGLDVTEKGEGKRAICADCHLESRPGQAFNPFELHAECRPKCPFVVNVKKRNAGQTNDVATQTFPVCKPGEDIFKRNAITQHDAPQQSGKLIDIIEDHGGFDVTEKGGGNRTVYADCHLEYRPDQADNLIELHAALRPKCPFVENVKKWNAGQTNDVATQTVPVREQGEDIFRGNAITQHAAPQQSGKLIDITEDQCEFDDTEKEIQEMDELLRCKVCLDSDACIVFLPCRHMATCEYCEGFLYHCPVCRSFIEEAVKINEE